jgi:hypothetical protein
MERKTARTENVKSGNTFGSKLIAGAQNIVGAITGRGTETAPSTREMTLPEFDVQVGSAEKKWYENPIVIIGGLAVLGGGIYLATRKK